MRSLAGSLLAVALLALPAITWGAGVPRAAAVPTQLPTLTRIPVRLLPDDSRLLEIVRLIKSGIPESVILERVERSGQAFDLSENDVLYLRQNGVPDSTIGALMATGTTMALAAKPRRRIASQSDACA
jgi:hypothetical protein